MPASPAISRRDFLSIRSSSLGLAPAVHEDGYWIRVFRRAMACRFEVLLPGEDAHLLPAARTALNLVDRLEARLSVFRPSSELSHVNRTAAERAVAVHPALFQLLHQSAELHTQTQGAFDITSTPLSRCWGFLARQPVLPDESSIRRALSSVGMGYVELDPAAGTVRFTRPGVELNLGSIGKGYALDRMAAALRRRGVRNALLSAGGSSILAVGADRGGWPIHVSSKLCGSVSFARLTIKNAAMATSGAGEQFVVANGRHYGHVLDPRTGWPASGVLSATVVTTEGCVADALATAFLIDGPRLAEQYCAAHQGTLAILVLDDADRRIAMFGACAGATLEEN